MIVSQTVRIIFLMALAFFMALLVTPLWRRIITNYKMGKQIRTAEQAPIFNNLHRKKAGVPTAGGVIVWFTVIFLAVFLHFFDYCFYFNRSSTCLGFVNRAETYLPLAALLIAALLGFLDDILGILRIGVNGGGLKIRYKFFVYTVIAAAGAWWFYFRLGWNELMIPLRGFFVPGHSFVDIGIWYIPLFLFIIIASAFSANETDGLDGLFGGVSLFAFGGLTTVAFALGRYDLAAFGGVTIGALLAFLWHNIYPAKFIMGDTGSMSLGITIGVIAMLTNTTLLLPFFFFIPVVESLSVIIQVLSKKIRGEKIFLSTPIHHHFEALGWPESQVTMRFWIISAVSMGLGLVIFFLSRFVS